MNNWTGIGRLCKDPEARENSNTKVARYTLAVDRRFTRDNEPTADFIPCVVFGKGAEFAEKYLNKGKKIAVTGRIQTGSYQNKDGRTIYTTDVIVESQEFVESKNAEQQTQTSDGFVDVPDSLEEELPFM